MNPNSANQLWSRWTFEIDELGRHVPRADVELNALRWLRKGFGSAGRARLTEIQTYPFPRGRRMGTTWRIDVLIEGKPAHDPAFVQSVATQFGRDFVSKGWGPLAQSRVTAEVLAGSKQDGKPPAQMIELPTIPLTVH